MYQQYPTYNAYTLPQGMTLKEKLVLGIAGVVVLGGAVILVRRMIRKQQADATERLTYLDGSAATYAKQIKMAFANDGWWGTNMAALRETIARIPSKQVLRQTMTAYQKLYNRSMLRDMESELQSSEYSEMLSIIAAKPEQYNANAPMQITLAQLQGWAGRLKAAFDKTYGPIPGTDEAAIKAVFNEIPTQTVFAQTGIIYKQLYGRDLITDLKGELEFWEYGPYMQIIQGKPR
ncbi:annexin [Chitinophaga polysaccharea]|uniref:annexin n=1 Tax=Chitinophaga polysaccharea TaxID=1293035 RepID=UPI0014555453|nr:annexin [Chitinophaga polysaccharea]NLR58835.1 annexin [Chitinophaga polysaccharea]